MPSETLISIIWTLTSCIFSVTYCFIYQIVKEKIDYGVVMVLRGFFACVLYAIVLIFSSCFTGIPSQFLKNNQNQSIHRIIIFAIFAVSFESFGITCIFEALDNGSLGIVQAIFQVRRVKCD